MYEAMSRDQFEPMWKAFRQRAASDFGTRAEADALRNAMLGQNDAFSSLIHATRQAQAQNEVLQRQQMALHARLVALSAVCGMLARGLVAAGVPAADVRDAITRARGVLPEDMREDGEGAVDAVMALIPNA